MFRTYVVGDNSLVKRLDNHTLPWVDLTSTLFPNLQMQSILDVMSRPSVADSAIIVGRVGGVSVNNKGILVTNNAGVTWGTPSGNYQSVWNTGFSWREVWCIDTANIVVAGDNGRVAISTDQGLVFR